MESQRQISAEVYQFKASIQRLFHGDIQPVDSSFRLVGGKELFAEEFYNEGTQGRFIVVSAHSVAAQRHAQLAEKGMPVMDASIHQDLLVLDVPEGARPLEEMVPLFGRDPATYGAVLFGLGRLFRQLEERGFGLPATTAEKSGLTKVAFVVDSAATEGFGLRLIPPYDYDKTMTFEAVEQEIAHELRDVARPFSTAVNEYLLRQVEHGRTSIG